MQSDKYRANLIAALRNLRTANESIFDSMVPLIMSGELKEWNDSVPIGEVHELNWELFSNSDDANIQTLVELISKVEDTFQKIRNLNAITYEDLDKEDES